MPGRRSPDAAGQPGRRARCRGDRRRPVPPAHRPGRCRRPSRRPASPGRPAPRVPAAWPAAPTQPAQVTARPHPGGTAAGGGRPLPHRRGGRGHVPVRKSKPTPTSTPTLHPTATPSPKPRVGQRVRVRLRVCFVLVVRVGCGDRLARRPAGRAEAAQGAAADRHRGREQRVRRPGEDPVDHPRPGQGALVHRSDMPNGQVLRATRWTAPPTTTRPGPTTTRGRTSARRAPRLPAGDGQTQGGPRRLAGPALPARAPARCSSASRRNSGPVLRVDVPDRERVHRRAAATKSWTFSKLDDLVGERTSV